MRCDLAHPLAVPHSCRCVHSSDPQHKTAGEQEAAQEHISHYSNGNRGPSAVLGCWTRHSPLVGGSLRRAEAVVEGVAPDNEMLLCSTCSVASHAYRSHSDTQFDFSTSDMESVAAPGASPLGRRVCPATPCSRRHSV
jgi:hypothetical protein